MLHVPPWIKIPKNPKTPEVFLLRVRERGAWGLPEKGRTDMASTETAEATLVRLDESIDEAASDADFARLDSLLADDFIYAHSTGTVQDKTEWMDSLKPLAGKRRRVVSGARADSTGTSASWSAMWTSSGTIARPSSTGTSGSSVWWTAPGRRSRSGLSRRRIGRPDTHSAGW